MCMLRGVSGWRSISSVQLTDSASKYTSAQYSNWAPLVVFGWLPRHQEDPATDDSGLGIRLKLCATMQWIRQKMDSNNVREVTYIRGFAGVVWSTTPTVLSGASQCSRVQKCGDVIGRLILVYRSQMLILRGLYLVASIHLGSDLVRFVRGSSLRPRRA